MLLCWKYSCQGATVVPMIEMMSSTAAEDVPPRMPGTARSRNNEWLATWACRTNGIIKMFTATKSIMKRSHRWNDPVAVMQKSATTAIGTDTKADIPKYSIESEMPMNSVMMIKKFRSRIELIETLPQRRPMRSRMSRP